MTTTTPAAPAAELEPAAWMYLHEFSTGTQHRVVCPQTERMEIPKAVAGPKPHSTPPTSYRR